MIFASVKSSPLTVFRFIFGSIVINTLNLLFRIIIDHFQVKNFIFVTIFLGFNCLIIVLL